MHLVPTLSEFREILEAHECVAVDFTASWCGPCKRIGPVFERLAGDMEGVHCVKVDVDDNEETAALFGVRAMPTFMFFHKGEKVEELVGASEAKLRSNMEMLLARASVKKEEKKEEEEDPFKPPVLDM